MRLRMPLLVLLLLAPLPAAGAQGDEKVFLVQSVARDGDTLVVGIRNAHYTVHAVVVSLTVDGALVPPEQGADTWMAQTSREVRFDGMDGATGTLTLRYARPDTQRRTETFTLRIPEPAEARLEVVDAALEGAMATVRVQNVGARASGPFVVALVEPGRGRVGDPLQHRVAGLAPGAHVDLRATLDGSPTALRVDVEHDGETRSSDVALRAPRPAEVEVVDADVRDGLANLTLLNVGGAPTGPLRVAVEDLSGTRIGSPLSRELEDLAPGARANVTFRVPAAADKVRVVLDHGSRTDTASVLLSARAGGGVLSLSTDLPSREGEPGGSVSYALTLSNEGAETLVGLRAEGLPEDYEVAFSIDGSAASSVQAPASGERRVVATLTLPEGAVRDVGGSLPFAVVANATDGASSARIELSLAVRGKGRLDLQGQNWFATARAGAPQEVVVTVRNGGSAALREVTLESTRPTGWQVAFEPSAIAKLDPGEARDVKVTLTPPEDAGAGRYVLDVSASTRDASARPRSLAVEVEGEPSSSLGWIVGAGLAGLAATALIVKLRRR